MAETAVPENTLPVAYPTAAIAAPPLSFQQPADHLHPPHHFQHHLAFHSFHTQQHPSSSFQLVAQQDQFTPQAAGGGRLFLTSDPLHPPPPPLHDHASVPVTFTNRRPSVRASAAIAEPVATASPSSASAGSIASVHQTVSSASMPVPYHSSGYAPSGFAMGTPQLPEPAALPSTSMLMSAPGETPVSNPPLIVLPRMLEALAKSCASFMDPQSRNALETVIQFLSKSPQFHLPTPHHLYRQPPTKPQPNALRRSPSSKRLDSPPPLASAPQLASTPISASAAHVYATPQPLRAAESQASVSSLSAPPFQPSNVASGSGGTGASKRAPAPAHHFQRSSPDGNRLDHSSAASGTEDAESGAHVRSSSNPPRGAGALGDVSPAVPPAISRALQFMVDVASKVPGLSQQTWTTVFQALSQDPAIFQSSGGSLTPQEAWRISSKDRMRVLRSTQHRQPASDAIPMEGTQQGTQQESQSPTILHEASSSAPPLSQIPRTLQSDDTSSPAATAPRGAWSVRPSVSSPATTGASFSDSTEGDRAAGEKSNTSSGAAPMSIGISSYTAPAHVHAAPPLENKLPAVEGLANLDGANGANGANGAQVSSEKPWARLVSQSSTHPHSLITGDKFIIGRHFRCNLQLEDATLSRTFAEITRQNGVPMIERLTKNGTLILNGSVIPVNAPVALESGDEIVVCASNSYACLFDTNVDSKLPPALGGVDSQPPVLTEAAALSARPAVAAAQPLAATLSPLPFSIRADSAPDPASPAVKRARLDDSAAVSGRGATSHSRAASPASLPPSAFPIAEARTYQRVKRFLLQSCVLKPDQLDESFDNFPYFLRPDVRDRLIESVYLFLKHPEIPAKHMPSDSKYSRSVLLLGQAGTEVYQFRLVKALAKHLGASLLVWDDAGVRDVVREQSSRQAESGGGAAPSETEQKLSSGSLESGVAKGAQASASLGEEFSSPRTAGSDESLGTPTGKAGINGRMHGSEGRGLQQKRSFSEVDRTATPVALSDSSHLLLSESTSVDAMLVDDEESSGAVAEDAAPMTDDSETTHRRAELIPAAMATTVDGFSSSHPVNKAASPKDSSYLPDDAALFTADEGGAASSDMAVDAPLTQQALASARLAEKAASESLPASALLPDHVGYVAQLSQKLLHLTGSLEGSQRVFQEGDLVIYVPNHEEGTPGRGQGFAGSDRRLIPRNYMAMAAAAAAATAAAATTSAATSSGAGSVHAPSAVAAAATRANAHAMGTGGNGPSAPTQSSIAAIIASKQLLSGSGSSLQRHPLFRRTVLALPPGVAPAVSHGDVASDKSSSLFGQTCRVVLSFPSNNRKVGVCFGKPVARGINLGGHTQSCCMFVHPAELIHANHNSTNPIIQALIDAFMSESSCSPCVVYITERDSLLFSGKDVFDLQLSIALAETRRPVVLIAGSTCSGLTQLAASVQGYPLELGLNAAIQLLISPTNASGLSSATSGGGGGGGVAASALSSSSASSMPGSNVSSAASQLAAALARAPVPSVMPQQVAAADASSAHHSSVHPSSGLSEPLLGATYGPGDGATLLSPSVLRRQYPLDRLNLLVSQTELRKNRVRLAQLCLAAVFILPPADEKELPKWNKKIQQDVASRVYESNIQSLERVLSACRMKLDRPLAELRNASVLKCKLLLPSQIDAIINKVLTMELSRTASTSSQAASAAGSGGEAALMSMEAGADASREAGGAMVVSLASVRKAIQSMERLAKGEGAHESGSTSAATSSSDRPRSSKQALLSPSLAENEYEKALLSNVILHSDINVTFDDIGALTKVKNLLFEMAILPLRRPELFKRGNLTKPCKGILLFGPPGTGKTLLAKAMAKQSGANFLNISISSVTSKWVGEGEKFAKAAFSVASKISPCIIFIDEIDSMLGKRDNFEHEGMRKIKNEFMAMWDGLTTKPDERVLVLGATNRPFDIDDAVLRRLPRRVLVDLPTQEERESILRVMLRDETLESDFDYGRLAQLLDGYSASDMRNVCIAAAYVPIREYLAQEYSQAVQSLHKGGGLDGSSEDKKQVATVSAIMSAMLNPPKPAKSRTKPKSMLARGPEEGGLAKDDADGSNDGEDGEDDEEGGEDSDRDSDKADDESSERPTPAVRPLQFSDFVKGKSEVSASVSESASSVAELRKWNEVYGEGATERSSSLPYFM